MKKLLNLILLMLFVPVTQAVDLPAQVQVVVPRPDIQDQNVTLVLTRYSVRDPNFFKVYKDTNSYTSAAASSGANTNNLTQISTQNLPIRTYRGHVLEQPNSTVMAVVWPGNTTMSAIINEGKRVLWKLDDTGIQVSSNGSITVLPNQASTSSLNTSKSPDWIPTFGNQSVDLSGVNLSQNILSSPVHGWSLSPDMQTGISRTQIAVDAEPEWFAQRANNSMELGLAIIEHTVNVLDLVYVRDLSMSHVLTSYVQRTDTDLHVKGSDAITTWKDNGLGQNPGANGNANSIPYQHVIWAYVNEGNPSAIRGKKPLDGGNFVRVPIKTTDPSGASHEIGHNWGGSHFVYPRDSMSGGGPWFGPTTVQRMIFLRDDATVGGALPKISNVTYDWNVHPYAMPDLVRIDQDQIIKINVLSNDYDGNGDDIALAHWPSVSEKGGTITKVNAKLKYTPPTGFTGRDTFTYLVTDGEFTNDAFVQIDVGGDLLLHYNFESLNANQLNPIRDVSGSNLHGKLINFAGDEKLVNSISGKGLRFPNLIDPTTLEDDDVRPFIEIGDVVDPLDGDHSVSIWIKLKPTAFNYGKPIYLLSNSSSVINTLVSGYNIYVDDTGNSFRFELREQLTSSSQSELTPLRNLTHSISGGILPNTWYHLVFTVNRQNNTIKAYVNGQAVTTDANSDTSLVPGSFIKGKPDGGRYISSGLGINTYKPKKYTPFIGVMDEVRIYGRSLSGSEVQQLYSNP